MKTPEKSAQWFLPWATLVLLLAAAAAIVLGGEHFARREEQVRVPADRGPVNIVAGSMEHELGRLERLYESDLRQLVHETWQGPDSPERIWQLCDSTVGVSQWSLIRPNNPKIAPDTHVPIDLKQSGHMPEPAFVPNNEALPRPHVLLSADELLQPDTQPWGWIDEPGKPLLFWQRSESNWVAIVLLIDPRPLRDVLKPWFAQWAAGDAFAPLRAAGGRAALLDPDDGVVVTAGAKGQGTPDFVLPIRSLFGTWQFALWDRTELRVHYDTRTQVVSCALAVLVALIGVIGFAQQRRALKLAAQRVSFVNRVSHELRTPLTNILLNLDLATETLDESAQSTGEPLRRFSLVREEAHRLARLIENALTFSRKQRGRLKSEPRACVPSGIIQAVVEQFAPSFARRALEVRCTGDVSAPCLLDADAFAQILSNLLSNVEKYVPGGIVEIASRIEDGVLVVTVTDEGPGIAPREAERIFQPFERLDSRINEGASGTGLGLAIARDLAIAAGGSLRLMPATLGVHGASFEMRLPAPPAPGIIIVSAA